MASTKRRKQSPLFSLSARMQRRESSPRVVPLDDHFDDDGCPTCIAARSGVAITADMLTNPAPAYLAMAARHVLEAAALGPGEVASIMETGRMLPDGKIKRTRFTVDAEGNIHRESDGERTFVTTTATS